MKDCENCVHNKTGDCAGFWASCIGFKPIPKIDPDILKAAQESIDKDRHRGNKYGSRQVAEREEKVKQAKQMAQNKLLNHNAQDTDLIFKRLKAWRLNEARRQGVPAYMVFTDVELRNIASVQIDNKVDLLRVSGIGERKYIKYSDAIWQIITDIET